MSLQRSLILLVGSDQSLAEVLDHLLTRCGYEVTLERHAEDAITKLTQGQFNLGIIDLQMPKLGGLGLIRNIRSSDTSKDLPLIAIAAEDQSSEIVEAFSLGASDCVTVPLDFPVVLARIKARLASKPAFEPLTPQEILLHYHIEASDEGSVLASPQNEWISFNKRFAKMWTIPEHLFQDPANQKGFNLILGQLKEPKAVQVEKTPR